MLTAPFALARNITSGRKSGSVAFTLIELLVVIAIIALLVSILLPSLKRAQMLARKAVDMSNVRQVGTGVFLYSTENGGMLPPANTLNSWSASWVGTQWDEALVPYIGGDLTWDPDSAPPASAKIGLLQCPFDPLAGWEQRQRRSYMWNLGRGSWSNGDLDESISLTSVETFSGSATFVLLGDNTNINQNDGTANATLGFSGGCLGNWWSFEDNNNGHPLPDGGRTLLFSDGHSEHLSALELTYDANGEILRPLTDYWMPSFNDGE